MKCTVSSPLAEINQSNVKTAERVSTNQGMPYDKCLRDRLTLARDGRTSFMSLIVLWKSSVGNQHLGAFEEKKL